MALGKAVRRIHPSHGRLVTLDEALEHVKKASEAGLIASVAHTWIDPVAFGLPDFDHLMFVCFCDDCCCIYRTHMKRRGPNLEKACKRLPGVSIAVHGDLCTGCAVCAEQCFVGAMDMQDGKAYVGGACKGCGRCIEVCPAGALSLCLEDEEILVERLMKRIQAVADIS
jgi:ferredoxin